MEYHVVLTESTNKLLNEFLLKDTSEEEICFVTWSPAQGKTRFNILLYEIIFPKKDDRKRHGTVSAMSQYVDRAKESARLTKKGLAMIHTHPFGYGSQGVSQPDLFYEQDVLSREVFGITGLPFVGLTLSGDAKWSARCYPNPYKIQWCSAVRIIGKNLTIHFNPMLNPIPKPNKKQIRTVSVWGDKKQSDIMRLKVGVIGSGSVGSTVSEILAKIGVGKIHLMDYDKIKIHNLDRMLSVSENEVGKNKAEIIAKNLQRIATNDNFECSHSESSIVEEDGFREALDCDVLFSCVDRPWPRQVMTHLAYSSLIPVIDGGISFSIPKGRFVHGMYRAQTIGPNRACLDCLGSIKMNQIQQDRDGLFDDPKYIEKQEKKTKTPTRQNIMPFVIALAGLETIQFVELVTNIADVGDIGQQAYDYFTGEIQPIHKQCVKNCFYDGIIAQGDMIKPVLENDKSKAREMNSKKKWDIKWK